MTDLDSIDYSTGNPAEFAVIWLHGLGADGHDFEDFPKLVNWPKQLKTRFIFPNAPLRAVTINMGAVMRAWYDIFDLDIAAKLDLPAVQQSVAQVQKLIASCEDAGIDSQNIIVAGFSQGAALAVLAALSYPKKLMGAVILSGYLLDAKLIEKSRLQSNKQLPFFVGHGLSDPVVPYILGEDLVNALKSWHHSVDFRQYDHQHNVSMLEFNQAAEWIIKKFSNST